MKIYSLGSNGFFPSYGRHTACYAIPLGEVLIVLDAGSGLFRFAEPLGQKLLRNIREVHLFLSHYHLDHIFGFYGAFKLFENCPVKVFAQTGRKIFSEFAKLDHFPIDYEREHRNFHWENLNAGTNKIRNYSVNIIKQNHRGEESMGFRFGFGVSYITDGEPNTDVVKFTDRSKVLLCESMFTGTEVKNFDRKPIEEQIFDGHITAIGAAMIAKKALVEKLVLIHHSPYHNSRTLERKLKESRKIFPHTVNAVDGNTIDF